MRNCIAVSVVGWGLSLAAAPSSAQQFIEIASRTAAGVQADSHATRGRISADARHVAFATASNAFDTTDTNGLIDVYLKDRVTGTIRRISHAPGGGVALGGNSGWDGFAPDQYGIAISADGARVAFLSNATNLVAGDSNGFRDAFLWDRNTDSITLLSKFGVAFGNQNSTQIGISGDGNLVAFSSFADNLLGPGVDTNATVDLYGYTVGTGALERISLTDADAQMPTAPSADRGALEPSLSHDGRYVGFSCEVNLNASDCGGQCREMWLRDRLLGTTVQVSRLAGEPTNTSSSVLNPVLSADGRFAAWGSFGDYALPDTDAIGDIFFRDIALGVTEHLSQTTDGQVGHNACGFPGISTGGRFVTFNCVGSFGPDDGFAGNDVYVRDRSLRQTLRYSVSINQNHPNNPSELPVITPDGQWLAFESAASNLVASDANGVARDIFLVRNPFLFDPSSRLGSRSSASASERAELSDDGRFVFFETSEPLLGGDSNGAVDIYRRELATGNLVRVSVGDNEGQIATGANDYAVSGDGNAVVFIALDDGSVVLKGEPAQRGVGKAPLTAVALLRNLITNSTQRMGSTGTPAKQPAISKDGTRVAFVSGANGLVPGDANGMDDVFVAEVIAPAVLTRVSAPVSGDANGASRAPALSGDGNVVVFETEASNVTTSGPPDGNNVADIVRASLATSQRISVSATSAQQGNGASTAPSVSGDGRHVVFASEASNLAGGDSNGTVSDVFLVDTASGVPLLLSSGSAGSGAGNAASDAPSISSDGNAVAFSSAASDLVGSDLNAKVDIFVVDRASLAKRRLARGDGGTQTNGDSDRPRLSRDGQHIVFQSQATNLSLLDANGVLNDVFVNGPLEPFLIFRSRFE